MILKGDCLLSPHQPSLFSVSKANKEEEQSHASFMHDVGKSFERFLAELDIYVKLTAIGKDEIDTDLHTKRNLNMKMIDLTLHGIIHQFTAIFFLHLIYSNG